MGYILSFGNILHKLDKANKQLLWHTQYAFYTIKKNKLSYELLM